MDTTSTRYSQLPESQLEMLLRLEENYPGLRFDSGFLGSVPVQAEGRLGSRWFFFRFRYDHASLVVGSPDSRTANGQRKRARIKALRKLRRNAVMDDFSRFLALRDLQPGADGLEHFPSHRIRAAGISDVTGEPYAGTLEPEEAASLFSRLMKELQPAPKRSGPIGRRSLGKSLRGRTRASVSCRHVISKN